MILSDIANLISARAYLASAIDNLNIKLSTEEVKTIQRRIVLFDRLIITELTSTDVMETLNRHYTRHAVSTEDTKTVLEKFKAAEAQTE